MNSELEEEFAKTTRLLLGTELRGLDSYGKWLGRCVPLPHSSKSVRSGKEVWLPPPRNYFNKPFDTARIVSMEEMDEVNTSPLKPDDLQGAGLKRILGPVIEPVRYACGNFRYQNYENFEKCSGGGGGRNVYYCEDVYLGSKNVAFSNYALFCENVFGSDSVTYCKFVIHAYNSTTLSRCFEADCCSNCSDVFFAHNCENVHDSMFCFNAKNLRYAIGNVPLPPDQYKAVKARLLAEMGNMLQAKKALPRNIFDLRGRNDAGKR